MMSLKNLVGEKIEKYTLTSVLGESEYGITFKATDTLQGKVAIKILKNDSKNWQKEAQKIAKLRDIQQIATVFDIGSTVVKIGDGVEKINYVVWEYVKGVTLASILKDKKSVSSVFIIDLIEQICHAIKEMQDVGLQHGNLHANNIILIPPKKRDPEQRHRVKIVDFGLAKSIRGESKKDMECLGDHIQMCWKHNRNYAGETLVHEKGFQSLLIELIKRMTDQERRLLDPVEAMQRIRQIEKRTGKDSDFQSVSLSEPFEYLSAAEMPENSDLTQDLYADNVPWLKEIEGFGTTIISGPRGSNKSMILKNMRLLTRLRSPSFSAEQLENVEFLGFYIQCQHSLYYPFAGLEINFDQKTCDRFIHYLNLLYTSEILESLIAFEDLKILKFSDADKNKLVSFLSENMIHEDASLYFLSSKNIIKQLKSVIEREILFIQKKILKNKGFEKQTSLDYLQNFIQMLDGMSAFFKNRKFYFLLDDYSKPKIHKMLQKSINRLVSYRNCRFCFKITTERFGFIQEDLGGKILQQDREYAFIDLDG